MAGANLPRPSTEENVSTTLSSGITDVAGSMDVADASKIVAPCYLVIDRVDSSGTLKSTSLWEYVKVTNVASNTLTITRAQNGSNAQAHSSGAIVEAVVTSAHFEDWYNVLNPEHDASGGHVITGTATVAGMNLASVATIASAGIGVSRAVTHLNASGASISGIPFGFGFYAAGFASGPTVSVARMIAHRHGTFRYFTAMTRTPVSGASLTLTVFNNLASVFDAGTMPAILGGGTFMSTASIKAPNFKPGDILTMDIVTGGNVADITLEGIAY
jgi:hypothetical protein